MIKVKGEAESVLSIVSCGKEVFFLLMDPIGQFMQDPRVKRIIQLVLTFSWTCNSSTFQKTFSSEKSVNTDPKNVCPSRWDY